MLNKPLGPKYTILLAHKEQFAKIVERRFNSSPEDLVLKSTPSQFRKSLVRALCCPLEDDEEFRELWKAIYLGDLKNGVRDKRFKAEEEGWPRKSVMKKNDRNSWICRCLRACFM